MKYFIAITLIAAVASAAVIRPLRSELAEIQEIIAAIQSPSTNPATAAALEQMLIDVLGVKPEPVAVGPAIIEYEPIAVGPAVIESEYEPIAVGPAVIESEYEPIAVGPAIITPVEGIAVGPAIVDGIEPISVGPAIIDFPLPEGALAEEPAIIPSPVSVVEATPTEIASGTPLVQIILNINQAAAESNPISVGPATVPEFVEIKPEPVHVVESALEPVQVVEAALEPVQVVEVAPVPAEPVQIGVPVIPEAAVILPEELN